MKPLIERHVYGFHFCSLHKGRVHITRATLEALGGEYEVELGNGGLRDYYLKQQVIDTFFVMPPVHRRKVRFTWTCLSNVVIYI